jgi:hypothetical protein
LHWYPKLSLCIVDNSSLIMMMWNDVTQNVFLFNVFDTFFVIDYSSLNSPFHVGSRVGFHHLQFVWLSFWDQTKNFSVYEITISWLPYISFGHKSWLIIFTTCCQEAFYSGWRFTIFQLSTFNLQLQEKDFYHITSKVVTQ